MVDVEDVSHTSMEHACWWKKSLKQRRNNASQACNNEETILQEENKTTTIGTNCSMSPRRLNCTCVPGPPGWSNNTGHSARGSPAKQTTKLKAKKRTFILPMTFVSLQFCFITTNNPPPPPHYVQPCPSPCH